MRTTQPFCSKEEFASRGEAIYKSNIEPVIGDQPTGDFVAIDIVSGQYEIAENETTASDRLSARVPDAQIWMRRVSSPYIRRFGASVRRT